MWVTTTLIANTYSPQRRPLPYLILVSTFGLMLMAAALPGASPRAVGPERDGNLSDAYATGGARFAPGAPHIGSAQQDPPCRKFRSTKLAGPTWK